MGNESNKNEGFTDIYNKYRREMWAYAYKFIKNREDAEDVVQEVFLRFFLLNSCEEIQHPRAWLSKAAKNRSLNMIRDRKDIISLQEQPYILDDTDDGPDVMDEFFEKMMKKEIREYSAEIMRALKDYNKKWFDAISYVYYQEIPGKDVADSFGMTRNAFDCMLQRAKKWIRKNYKEEYDRIMEAK